MRHKLVENASGAEVKPGMRLIRDGQIYELVDFQVRQPPSTGRVRVRNVETRAVHEYYPSVFDLRIEEVPHERFGD